MPLPQSLLPKVPTPLRKRSAVQQGDLSRRARQLIDEMIFNERDLKGAAEAVGCSLPVARKVMEAQKAIDYLKKRRQVRLGQAYARNIGRIERQADNEDNIAAGVAASRLIENASAEAFGTTMGRQRSAGVVINIVHDNGDVTTITDTPTEQPPRPHIGGKRPGDDGLGNEQPPIDANFDDVAQDGDGPE